MEVIIKPHHLKGNSFVHFENPEKRNCPLHEALVEAGRKPHYVGATYVSFPSSDPARLEFYDIDQGTWSGDIAPQAIRNAKNGSQNEITVKLIKNNKISHV